MIIFTGNNAFHNGHDGTDGNGGPATSASLASGNGLTADTVGRLYHAGSTFRIRTIDPVTGIIYLIAGALYYHYYYYYYYYHHHYYHCYHYYHYYHYCW